MLRTAMKQVPEAMSSLLARFEQNARLQNSSGVIGMLKQLLSTISITPKVKKSEHPAAKDPPPSVANGNAKSKSEKRKVGRLEEETLPLAHKKKKKLLVGALA